MTSQTLPVGTKIYDSWECVDRNRYFIIGKIDGSLEKWVRCGCTGVWLEQVKIEKPQLFDGALE